MDPLSKDAASQILTLKSHIERLTNFVNGAKNLDEILSSGEWNETGLKHVGSSLGPRDPIDKTLNTNQEC